MVPTQVDASTSTQTILVPGRLIGVDVGAGGPQINTVSVRPEDGRTLTSADEGSRQSSSSNATSRRSTTCRARGSLLVAGTDGAATSATALSPEYFFVVTDDGGFFAEANFAAVFAPLRTAQALAGSDRDE